MVSTVTNSRRSEQSGSFDFHCAREDGRGPSLLGFSHPRFSHKVRESRATTLAVSPGSVCLNDRPSPQACNPHRLVERD